MRCSLNEKVNIKIGGDFDPPRCIRVAFPGSGGVVSRDGLCLSVLHADCIARGSSPHTPTDPLPQRDPCGLHRRQRVCDDQAPALCLSVLHANCINTVHSDSVNTIFFASACSMRIASPGKPGSQPGQSALPQRAPCGLHPGKTPRMAMSTHFASACSMRIEST